MIKDRPIKEIIASMMLLISEGRVKGQFARDLEKLCAQAMRAPDENHLAG